MKNIGWTPRPTVRVFFFPPNGDGFNKVIREKLFQNLDYL
jgi:hypothetical protein